MDLLWDILREMGILKKGGAKQEQMYKPRRKRGRAEHDPHERQRRSIEGDDPAAVARAVKRMIRK